MVFAASFRADGKQLIVGVAGATGSLAVARPEAVVSHALLIDVAGGKATARIEYTPKPRQPLFNAVAVAPDGKQAAVSCNGSISPPAGSFKALSRVWLWDATKKEAYDPVGSLGPIREGWTYSLHYLPGGRHLLVVGSYALRIWDLETDRLIEPEGASPKALGTDLKVAIAPGVDGTVHIAAVTSAGVVHVWKVTLPAKR
jgi:hypothetical protein